ncbi:MAG TPA: hypothetical protein VF988_16665 [Verrucomicrobiae bacterium]
MTKLQKAIIATTLTAAVGIAFYEAHQAAVLRRQYQELAQQQAPLLTQLQLLQRERDVAVQRLAAIDQAAIKAGRNDLELLKLRNEVARLRRAGTAGEPVPSDIGRELGMAIIHGDAGAFKQLLAEYSTEQQIFRASAAGLSAADRSRLEAWTFAPVHTAFDLIEDAANQGNASALRALTSAMENADIRDLAAARIGHLAANGDRAALDILVHPQKYGVSRSATISALQPAADSGNQAAINALAAAANDSQNQDLWFLAAKSLTKAAAAGNSVAINALINMSATTNQAVRYALSDGLTAAASQNTKAAEALKSMGPL